MTTVCLIPGDGVGQEVVPAAAQVLAAACPGLRFVEADAGWTCFERCGSALPDATVQAVLAADAVLFGATQSPISGETPVRRNPHPLTGGLSSAAASRSPAQDASAPGKHPERSSGAVPAAESKDAPAPDHHPERSSGSLPAAESKDAPSAVYRSPILALRRQLDLYANLRPTTSLLPGDRAIDLLIVRENTEGLYAGHEHRDGDTAIAERVITRRASERIARVAFEQARLRLAERGRASVTVIHKANVLKLTDGLFRECCFEVAGEYPDVTVDEMLVDAAAMWLAKEPRRFDVLVTTNLFGDILSDLAAGLTGGLGVAPSANVGAGRIGVFEPVHGSAPDIAGRGIANPTGAILSAAMLLDHIGQPDAASRMRAAVRATLRAGITTPDLGGRASTAEVADAVAARV